jgi:hypothetical protein
MDFTISLEEVANIAAFIAPGYFFIGGYTLIYSRDEKHFSRLLVECIAISLPLVGVYNFVWERLVSPALPPTISLRYFVPLILASFLCGFLVSHVRQSAKLEAMLERLNIPGPDNDFIKVQFRKLKPSSPVTITLKNGEIFSGTPKAGNGYSKGRPREYVFNDIAWYNPGKQNWDERKGSLIINLDTVQYMETVEKLAPPTLP